MYYVGVLTRTHILPYTVKNFKNRSTVRRSYQVRCLSMTTIPVTQGKHKHRKTFFPFRDFFSNMGMVACALLGALANNTSWWVEMKRSPQEKPFWACGKKNWFLFDRVVGCMLIPACAPDAPWPMKISENKP